MKIIRRIKINSTVVVKHFLSVWGVFSALVSLLLTFISWNDIGISKLAHKMIILVAVVIAALIIAVASVFAIRKKTIFGDLSRGLSIEYGDIIKLGFDNCGKKKKIIVIPVNRCFDLSCENNLIVETSIHGQWINNYLSSEAHRNEVHRQIESALAVQNVEFTEIDAENKQHGYSKCYAPGSIVELNGINGITFYLWGISELDSDLKANCTETDYFKALQQLVEYYDSHGQCVDLYCPVFGDHIIRPTRPTEDILHFMISVFTINKSKIHGNIHIVVFDQKKADVSILRYCN